MKRLFGCSLSLVYGDARRETTATALIADLTDFWWNERKPDEPMLWDSKIYLVSARKPLYRSFPVTIHHTFRASCSPISSRKMPAIGLGGVIGGGPAPIFGTRP